MHQSIKIASVIYSSKVTSIFYYRHNSMTLKHVHVNIAHRVTCTTLYDWKYVEHDRNNRQLTMNASNKYNVLLSNILMRYPRISYKEMALTSYANYACLYYTL
jgi:hypothetical protein